MNTSKEIQWGKHRVSRRWLLQRAGVGVSEIVLGVASRPYDKNAGNACTDAGLMTLFATFRMRIAKRPDPLISGSVLGIASNLYRRSQMD
jgi:hypothetical protein